MRIILTINEDEVSEGVKKNGGIEENIRIWFNEIDDNFGNVKVELIEE